MADRNGLAFAAPRTEEMTKVVAGIAGAGITGAVEGIIIKMAPQMGAAAPILTWGTLLGIPIIGAAGALFTRGMVADLFTGIAAGGAAILGYSLPEFLAPITGRKAASGGGQLASGAGVKLLQAGGVGAPQRAQVAARVGLEI